MARDETIRAIPQIPRGEIPAALVKVLDAMKEDIELLAGLRDPQYIVNYVISGGSPDSPTSGVGTGDVVTLLGDVIGQGVFDALGDVEIDTTIDLPNLICIDGGAADTIYTSQPAGPYGVMGSGGSNLNIRDEGNLLTAAATLLNFVGTGVVATEPVPGEITVTIAGGGGTDEDEKTYNRPGTLAVLTGTARWYPTKTISVIELRANVGVPPAGQDIKVDVLKNGVLDTTLTIAQGNYLSTAATVSIALLATDYVTIDITQVGSTTKGADLVVSLKYT